MRRSRDVTGAASAATTEIARMVKMLKNILKKNMVAGGDI